jgi:hypothetical protein
VIASGRIFAAHTSFNALTVGCLFFGVNVGTGVSTSRKGQLPNSHLRRTGLRRDAVIFGTRSDGLRRRQAVDRSARHLLHLKSRRVVRRLRLASCWRNASLDRKVIAWPSPIFPPSGCDGCSAISRCCRGNADTIVQPVRHRTGRIALNFETTGRPPNYVSTIGADIDALAMRPC